MSTTVSALKLRCYHFRPYPQGWVCECCFLVETANQFTPEEHTVFACGRWLWLAWWNGHRRAKRKAAKLRAQPGERAAKGWVG